MSETRDLFTSLPQQINRQIDLKNTKISVNALPIQEQFNDGVSPIALTELSGNFEENIKPAPPSLGGIVSWTKGSPTVKLTVTFNGRDDNGHPLGSNDTVIAIIYRDNDNNGTFEETEILDQINLAKTNIFYDRDCPKLATLRYRINLVNQRNKCSNWSNPFAVDTTDAILPYVPIPPVIITEGVRTDSSGNICNAVLKIEKHFDDDFLKIEIYTKSTDPTITEWYKQPDIDFHSEVTKDPNSTPPNIPYYYCYLQNLTPGRFYSVKIRAVRNSGNVSDFSMPMVFRAGDFVKPGDPANVTANNISVSGADAIEVHWNRPSTSFADIAKYAIYRTQYDPNAGSFIDGSRLLMAYVSSSSEVNYIYKDDTPLLNKWYTYEVISIDSSVAGNPSSPIASWPVQVIENIDTLGITVSFTGEPYNFPISIAWTAPIVITKPFIGIKIRENHGSFKVIYSTYIPAPATNFSLSLLDIFAKNEQGALSFMDIYPWLTIANNDQNYKAELYQADIVSGNVANEVRLGVETFLINPKMNDVSDFIANYSPISHAMNFKWTANTQSTLTGYEIRRTDLAGYNQIHDNQGSDPISIGLRNQVWDLAPVLANSLILKKNVNSFSWPVPLSANPADSAGVVYYFIIKAVGDFYAHDQVFQANSITKAMYSQDPIEIQIAVFNWLPAPISLSAVLDGAVIRAKWDYQSSIQAKKFFVYISKTHLPLEQDPPSDDYRVWIGSTNSVVIDKLPNGDPILPDTQYYLKVYPVDNSEYLGYGSDIFQNSAPVLQFAKLPKPYITGVQAITTLPLPFGQTTYPAMQGQSIDVYNTRTMQFAVDSFTKDIYVDRINWYISLNKGAFAFVKTTRLDPTLTGTSGVINRVIENFSTPIDITLFQIMAVQASPVREGDKLNALFSKYSKIDTEPPVVSIDKIVYYSDGTNAINKNNYLNKKALSGIVLTYSAFELNPNSGIKSIEYIINGTVKVAPPNEILIAGTDLGADIDPVTLKYRDISITLRAKDNADNAMDKTVTFRKDTVGPFGDSLPTNISYSCGKTIKIKWTNPTTPDRNLFDGVRIKLPSVDAYDTMSSAFEYKPISMPSHFIIGLYAIDIAENETLLQNLDITNYPPQAPTGVITEGSIGGCRVKWDAVTLDTGDPLHSPVIPPGAEDVEKYEIQYQIGVSPSGTWQPASGNIYAYDTSAEIALTSTEEALCSSNTSYYVWVQIRAIDTWGLAGAYSSSAGTGARPKIVEAVNMSGNIFKFAINYGGGLAKVSGTDEWMIDADYDVSKVVSVSNSVANAGYIEIDMIKAEWMPEIKLRFQNGNTNTFFIAYLENSIDGFGNPVKTWKYLQSSSSSSHDIFGQENGIEKSTTLDTSKYFSYTQAAGNNANAWFKLTNCNGSDKRAVFCSAIRIIFHSAVVVDVCEVQPIVQSMANIFYGSILKLDDMISIKSTADLNNYLAMDSHNFVIYGLGTQKIILGDLTAWGGGYGGWFKDKIYIGGTSPSNAAIRIDATPSMSIGPLSSDGATGTASIGTSSNSQVSSTGGVTQVTQVGDVGWSNYNQNYLAFGVGSYGSNTKVIFGKLDTGVYGTWMTDGVYIGGSYYGNAQIKLQASDNTIYMGYISAYGVYNTLVSSTSMLMGRIGNTVNFGVSLFSDGSVYLGYSAITGSLVNITSSDFIVQDSVDYKKRIHISDQSYLGGIGINYIVYANSKYYFDTIIQAGALYLGFYAARAEYHQSYNMKILSSGIFIGHTGEVNGSPAIARYNLAINSSSIGIGYVGSDSSNNTVYNALITGSSYQIGIIDYNNLYYNTKISSGLIQLGHVSSGTVYKVNISSSETSFLGYDNSAFFKIGQYSMNGVLKNLIWAKSILLSNSSGDNPQIDASETSKIFVWATDTLRPVYVYSTINNSSATGIYCISRYGIAAIMGVVENLGGTRPTANVTAGVKGISLENQMGIYGSSISGVGGYFTSQGSGYNAAVYALNITGHGVYGIASGSGGAAIAGEGLSYGCHVTASGSSGVGVYGIATGSAGKGIYGTSPYIGIHGYSAAGVAGYFESPSTTTGAALSTLGQVQFQSLGAASGTGLVIDSSGFVRPYPSARRYKSNIVDLPPSYVIDNLREVAFNLNGDGSLCLGLIAEDVNEIYPELVIKNKDGQCESVKYTDIIAILIKEIKDIKKQLLEFKK